MAKLIQISLRAPLVSVFKNLIGLTGVNVEENWYKVEDVGECVVKRNGGGADRIWFAEIANDSILAKLFEYIRNVHIIQWERNLKVK